jgi:hypothetical protein
MDNLEIIGYWLAADKPHINPHPRYYLWNLLDQQLIECACQACVIRNLKVMGLALGMKICDLWKYYFQLIKYNFLDEFGKIGHTKVLVARW